MQNSYHSTLFSFSLSEHTELPQSQLIHYPVLSAMFHTNFVPNYESVFFLKIIWDIVVDELYITMQKKYKITGNKV